jgi:type IV secretion system protein VirB1
MEGRKTGIPTTERVTAPGDPTRGDAVRPDNSGPCRMELLTLIATCAPMVAPTTMKAIVLEESRGHPYAIHNGRTHEALFPATREEAIATARRLLAEGTRIDAGLAQINSQNWDRLDLTPETVFDPCTNLQAGERIVLGDYIAAPYTVDAAISRYNTGDESRGIRNGYVGRVKGWMPKPPPSRDYAGAGHPPSETEEGPATVRVSPDAEGEENLGDEAMAQARPPSVDQIRKATMVPAWSFVPVTDGFGEGG